MQRRGARFAIVGFGLLAALIAVAFSLTSSPRADVAAQPPTVDDRLDQVQDDLARLRSELGDARSDLARTLEELSELRGDVAVLAERIGRLSAFRSPPRAELDAYTQAFVERAITMYERDGREAAFAHYNSPESVDGQWYIFIIDEQGLMAAHADPARLGTVSADITGPDGYPAGRMVEAAATSAGAWVDYQFTNLDNGRTQVKHSWVVRHDGLIFGSGWYEDGSSKVHEPGAYTQSFVQRAIHLYVILGREAALGYYSSAASVEDQWYVFIFDEDGRTIAHPVRPDLIGGLLQDSGVDLTGHDYGSEILAVETSGWVSYVFGNPADDQEYQRKHAWIVRHDGLRFASGWYERNYDLASEEPAGYTRLLVQQAIERYDAEGREAAISHYNAPESVDSQWYVFIFDADGQILASPTRPDLVGTLMQDLPPDAEGVDFGSALLAVTDSGWVSYLFGNPQTGEQERKHTWVRRHEGLSFAAGWYEADAEAAPDS